MSALTRAEALTLLDEYQRWPFDRERVADVCVGREAATVRGVLAQFHDSPPAPTPLPGMFDRWEVAHAAIADMRATLRQQRAS